MFKDYNSKFTTIVEEVTSRTSNGGFLQGDYVQFRKNYAKHPWFAGLNERYKEDLQHFVDTKNPIKIAAIRTDKAPSAFGLATGQEAVGAPHFADVYEEIAPGRYGGAIISVPIDVLSVISTGANWSPPTDQWKKEPKLTYKPEEVKSGDENRTRSTKNTVIKSKSATDGRAQIAKPVEKNNK